MLKKILNKVFEVMHLDRKDSIEENIIILYSQDSAGCNSYLLKGIYKYDEVVRLNAVTNYNAGFGFCYGLGPVAFIGVPNAQYAQKSGYFTYKVHEYAVPWDGSVCYFKAYTEDEAKHIANYTVYGCFGYREVAEIAAIDKLSYIYDSRYRAKEIKNPKIIDMDCKLSGKYSYNAAKMLATGTIEEKVCFSENEQPIVFAIVGNKQPIGIINIWPSDTEFVNGFRDVWEYGTDQPEIKTISFLTEQEAVKYHDYELYIYEYTIKYDAKYDIEKYDRTFDERFEFQLPDGRDYRLM